MQKDVSLAMDLHFTTAKAATQATTVARCTSNTSGKILALRHVRVASLSTATSISSASSAPSCARPALIELISVSRVKGVPTAFSTIISPTAAEVAALIGSIQT